MQNSQLQQLNTTGEYNSRPTNLPALGNGQNVRELIAVEVKGHELDDASKLSQVAAEEKHGRTYQGLVPAETATSKEAGKQGLTQPSG